MRTLSDAPATQNRHDSEEARKWVEIARSLAPLVESEVLQASRDSIITSKVIRAWKEAGLYGVMIPKSLGGAGVDDMTYLQIAEEIARQDASAGWVYANHQTGTLFPGMLLSEEAFRELIGPDADGVACGSGSPGGVIGTAKRVDGGFLIEVGARYFGSGSQHATRVVAQVALVDDNDQKLVGDDGNPVVVFVWVDRKNVEWLNDWNPSGLHGTGSGSYRIKRHVIEEKWLALGDAAGFDDPAFTQGFHAVPTLHHIGLGLGLAKRALEEVVRSTRGRRRGAVPALDEYPIFQAEFVRIESLYQAARSLAMDAYHEVWEAAKAHSVTELHLARIEQASLFLYRALDDIMSTTSLWAGSDVIASDGIFARLNANARVAMNHVLVGPQQAAQISTELLKRWQPDS